jgi:hypothetical protein
MQLDLDLGQPKWSVEYVSQDQFRFRLGNRTKLFNLNNKEHIRYILLEKFGLSRLEIRECAAQVRALLKKGG